MKKIKMVLAGLLIIPAIALAVAPATQAADFELKTGVDSAKGKGASDSIDDPSATVKQVVNIFLWAIGALSVFMLIWGGIRYTTSAGDSNKVTAAKNTIIYAIVGLVVAILAYAIVNLVVNQFGEG